jgi:jumonji domain-containing protein 2
LLSPLQGWTLRNLDTVLSKTLAESGHDLPGVSSPYLYYGMWRSTFAW